ncbi:MAG: phage tail sheath subtilisin-like domain-containing protein [Pseudomonadota bacterium]
MSGFLHGVETIELDVGLRPIQVVRSSVIGLIGTAPDADTDAFPADTPVLVAGSRTEAAKLGETGTLPAAIDGIFDQAGALVVVVRVEEGVDAAQTMANVIGGVDATTGAYEGLQCFLAAENVVKVTPRILIAPGFTQNVAVTSNMIAIADRLRAVIFVDGPNTNDADAITFRGSFGSDRVYVVDPWVKVFDPVTATNVEQPPSARVAGITARTDQERGFWWSPSNQLMNGIVGTARDVSFGLSDPLSRANLLNEGEVATIIQKDGYRLWGNRSATADPLWAFISVRRTADMIYESIEQGHLWAMDRPMSAQLILDIQEGVAAFLRSLQARGAVLGFNVWVDPDLNTEATLKAGQFFINFDFEPPAPLERLTFMASRNGDYYNDLIERVIAA